MADPITDERDSTYRRAMRRVDSTRVVITDRAVDLEGRVPAIQAAVRAWEHDRAVGGEIMAGAIAFRAFVFLLPYVLVLVTLLGFASRVESPEEVVKQVGITGLAAQSVSESARASNSSLWIALIIGLVALYSTSKALARVLRIAHGPLGGAVAILGWTYLVGRLAVSSAVLNASLYRQRDSQKLGDVSAELPD